VAPARPSWALHAAGRCPTSVSSRPCSSPARRRPPAVRCPALPI